MANRAEELFDKLQDAAAIRELIGQSEDLHFDCKEWPNDNDAQKVFAKAACGLTNAEGGVIVIGMKARSRGKDEPDLVEAAVPVGDTAAVKSRVLDLVGQLVEPGIEGVRASEIDEPTGSRTGFVVVYIPPSEGHPRRSRKDWKFYLRIGSGTFPMEYFQIEERFGERPVPKLELHLEEKVDYSPSTHQPARCFVLALRNAGRGIAKFPSIRFKYACGLMCDDYGIDGNGGVGLPRRASEPEWVVFRGGIDDVIYPEEVRQITRLWQEGSNIGPDGNPYSVTYPARGGRLSQWDLKAVRFECEISCEGAPTATAEKLIEENIAVRPLKR